MWKIGPSFRFWDGPLWTVRSWSRLLKVHCLFHMREDLLDELCDIAAYMVGLSQIWPRALEACCSNLETWHECKQNCTSNLGPSCVASFIDAIFQLHVIILLKSCHKKSSNWSLLIYLSVEYLNTDSCQLSTTSCHLFRSSVVAITFAYR